MNHELLMGRKFKVWDYSPSFSRLLIRSPRFGDSQVNIDIVFWGVDHLELDTSLGEISLDVEVLEEKPSTKRITITSPNGKFMIVATNYPIFESDTDMFDSPIAHI